MTNDTPNMPAGWYHAEGDAPGTQRYWDGSSWQGEPQAVASAAGGAGSMGSAAAGAGMGAMGAVASSPMDYFKSVITPNYANFSGRARRAEYWWFTLISFVISLAINIIGLLGDALGSIMSIVGLLFSLALLIPSLAVTVRRLHDTGKSAWWLLLIFIPVLGWIALLVFYFIDSDRGTNAYGPSPKYGA